MKKINQFLKIAMLIVFVIIVVISIMISIMAKKEEPIEPNKTNDTKEVLEVSRVMKRNDFFTVTNCVDRYITYLTTKEPDILYDYLDKSYRKANGITKNNVLTKIETLDDYYKFKAKEMYVTKLSDTLEQYFVYGILTPEGTEETGEKIEFYISIKMDRNNNTFSVIPNEYIQNKKVVEN